MKHNQNIGKIGETIAKQYLIKNGHQILFSNKRMGKDEIDIISRKLGIVYFIEVKTRLSSLFGSAEEQFSHKKISRLKRSAYTFCLAKNVPEEHIKIEGIAINLNVSTRKANISHFKSII